MSDRLLEAARKRGLTLPPPPYTPEVLGELAADMFVRPQRMARRMAREKIYLLGAQRRMVQTPAGEVAVWQWGPSDGLLVGLVHGWDGHGAQLGAFAAPLVTAGFRVLTLDAPGHGESPGDEAHVPLLARVLVGLESNTGPFHALIGHSMGAAAAATATRCGSRPHGLVLLAPPLSQLDRVERVASRLELAPPVRQVFIRAVERRTATRFADADLMAVARLAPCPLLVFHDPADPETSYADSEKIVAQWRGAQIVPCPGRGHYRILATPEIIRLTVRFIAGLTQANPG
jgi:pimeloyl-ACP methyl ester carboxylesterase